MLLRTGADHELYIGVNYISDHILYDGANYVSNGLHFAYVSRMVSQAVFIVRSYSFQADLT